MLPRVQQGRYNEEHHDSSAKQATNYIFYTKSKNVWLRVGIDDIGKFKTLHKDGKTSRCTLV